MQEWQRPTLAYKQQPGVDGCCCMRLNCQYVRWSSSRNQREAVRTLIPAHRGEDKQQKNTTPTCQSLDSQYLSPWTPIWAFRTKKNCDFVLVFFSLLWKKLTQKRPKKQKTVWKTERGGLLWQTAAMISCFLPQKADNKRQTEWTCVACPLSRSALFQRGSCGSASIILSQSQHCCVYLFAPYLLRFQTFHLLHVCPSLKSSPWGFFFVSLSKIEGSCFRTDWPVIKNLTRADWEQCRVSVCGSQKGHYWSAINFLLPPLSRGWLMLVRREQSQHQYWSKQFRLTGTHYK